MAARASALIGDALLRIDRSSGDFVVHLFGPELRHDGGEILVEDARIHRNRAEQG